MFEKDLTIAYLLDFYGDILSDRKKNVLDGYYNQDLSLTEIADQIGITRQGVRELIKKAEQELCFYEEKLGLARKLKQVESHTQHIISLLETVGFTDEVKKELHQLEEDLK